MDSSTSTKQDDEAERIPENVLNSLSEESRTCLQRLLAYETPPAQNYGIVKTGAVLVALFEREGRLRVLLTTRAKTLRRHPGLTALPGGKIDPEDPSVIHAARREAFEEVGLPLAHPSIFQVTILSPVMTILPLNAHPKNHIVVTRASYLLHLLLNSLAIGVIGDEELRIAVVCFLSDPTLISSLEPSPDEVDHVFSHPLDAIFSAEPAKDDVAGLAESGGEWWPHPEDYYSMADRTGVTGWHRMHRFRTTHSPIKGLTADVLIELIIIAYGHPPSYGALGPHQPTFEDAIRAVILDLPARLAQDIEDERNGVVRPVGKPEWGSGDGTMTPSAEVWSTKV